MPIVLKITTAAVIACLIFLGFATDTTNNAKVRSHQKLRDANLLMLAPMLAHFGPCWSFVRDRTISRCQSVRTFVTTVGSLQDPRGEQALWLLIAGTSGSREVRVGASLHCSTSSCSDKRPTPTLHRNVMPEPHVHDFPPKEWCKFEENSYSEKHNRQDDRMQHMGKGRSGCSQARPDGTTSTQYEDRTPCRAHIFSVSRT